LSSRAELHDLVVKAATRDKAEVSSLKPEPESSPDPSVSLKEYENSYRIGQLEQQLEEARDTHKLRLGYAGKIFRLVVVWLACVIGAVFLAGLNYRGFALSDGVLIAFITSSTASVVGLFFVVAKWMFPDGSNRKDG
jgi:hypothetical protein